ncbi:MAG: hypothetical protein RIC80_15405 [Cyclobacteriaceae bacterium]
MNKRATLSTLIAGSTLIGAASYFFFSPVKAKVMKGLDKIKTNKNITISKSHDDMQFV